MSPFAHQEGTGPLPSFSSSLAASVRPFVQLRQLVRSVSLLLLLCAPAALTAQSSRPQSPPMNGVAHVAFQVADVKASRAFYQKLGYEEFFAFEKDGVISQSFIKVNDRQFIELYPASDTKPVGFLHLCFDGVDLNALHDFNVSQGLTPKEVRKAGAGNLLFTQRGPDDQNIEYTQYMPGSRHSEDRGKHLGPNRISDKFFAVALGMKDVPAAVAFYAVKLAFPVVPGHPDLFRIPGTSGQQVLIEPYVSPRGHIFFAVHRLKDTARELKQRGIPFASGKGVITVTDPDGNLLDFKSVESAQ